MSNKNKKDKSLTEFTKKIKTTDYNPFKQGDTNKSETNNERKDE
jgi:hypothetical protein